MFKRLMGKFLPKPAGGETAAVHLPTVPRERIAHLLCTRDGLPQLDWGMAAPWIERGGGDPAAMRLAIAAAWLDELRDALEADHRRWRRPGVEGLAPLEGSLSLRIAGAADRALAEIRRALRPIRGDVPIAPVGVVALGRTDDYYSFVAHFHPEEGEWATSGGMYINMGDDSFPVLALDARLGWAAEDTVAHELTHHALHGLGLPLWAEEGLTQMMEERTTGRTDFHIDRLILDRHREHWDDSSRLARFWDGETFSSPEGEDQELSYHLAQMVVRGLLEREPDRFFAFARACSRTEPTLAAAEHLSTGLDDVVEAMLGIGPSDDR